MFRRLFIVFIFLAGPLGLLSQITPGESSKLHYRLIPFSFPAKPGTSSYKIDIGISRDSTEADFNKNIIKTLYTKENKLIVEVPHFGREYTWRVTYIVDKKPVAKSRLYHFSIDIIPEVDETKTRVRVLKQAVRYKDAYVFLDGTRSLCDMNGRPVWYLPYIDGTQSLPADLKLSSKGTITFLLDEQAYEINFYGDILWKAPNNGAVSGDTVEHYHHEFTRLLNGNYMVLGNEIVFENPVVLKRQVGKPVPVLTENNQVITGVPRGGGKPYGTIIEYNKKGEVVWFWKSSKYFTGAGVDSYVPADENKFRDIHENSFFFDDNKNNIYLSCKNISRIIKIQYPEGKVLNNYGEIFKQGMPVKGNAMFCGQHSCRISRTGHLYMYNNNICDTGSVPKVTVLREPVSENDSLTIFWEYECPIDRNMPKRFDGGGNVIELPDNAMFVSMNRAYSKIFIVSNRKEMLWSAVPEKKDGVSDLWDVIAIFRASIIPEYRQLENLIWGRHAK